MPATAEQQLDEFIGRYDPKIAALARKALAHMKKRLPGALVTVYDNYNALAIGFGPITGKQSATPLSIALYPRWINLFFMFGVRLPDPHKLMKGAGARVRSIRLEGMDTLKDEAVDDLISAAVLDTGWKLDPKARGKLEIRMISKNQRPRRP
jgi:hypothetical protein